MMPEDRLEPKEVAKMLCPQCGLVQDFASCKCGEPLCDHCDPDPEIHVRCMPPERRKPYDLLVDARLCLLRIRLAIRRGDFKLALQAAEHFDNELVKGGIA
jgi:hypothetical protein